MGTLGLVPIIFGRLFDPIMAGRPKDGGGGRLYPPIFSKYRGHSSQARVMVAVNYIDGVMHIDPVKNY